MSFYRPSTNQSQYNPPSARAGASELQHNFQGQAQRYTSDTGSVFAYSKPERQISGHYRPDYGVTLNDQVTTLP